MAVFYWKVFIGLPRYKRLYKLKTDHEDFCTAKTKTWIDVSMSTLPNPPFAIEARFLGPILNLNCELTKNAQNLIFARNGTGKSFLSRAFRYLDLHGEGKDTSDASLSLVSDESIDGRGSFSFTQGTETYGELKLNRGSDAIQINSSQKIFHVFSEDFVQKELRERAYVLQGEIENQIALDGDNIDLQDIQNSLSAAENSAEQEIMSLGLLFEASKTSELKDKAGVNRQLSEFKSLNLLEAITKNSVRPSNADNDFSESLESLSKLKSIPLEPKYPSQVGHLPNDLVNLPGLESSLKKETSPSSVAHDIKEKLDKHNNFYKTGLSIIDQDQPSTCPFCEQRITDVNPKQVIDAYIKYFNAEEEDHKSELRTFLRSMLILKNDLGLLETALLEQTVAYEALKVFIPSQKNKNLLPIPECVSNLRNAYEELRQTIIEKAQSLSEPSQLPSSNLLEATNALNDVVDANNEKVEELSNSIEKSDNERKILQRTLCKLFESKFLHDNWPSIANYKTHEVETTKKKAELAVAERSRPSANAKKRVAETFELLLKAFFSEKYIFCKESFTLKRGQNEMGARGPSRTLSDGEKTAIAFCYFIACVHKKVSADADYKNLFLVFDDPVTSMSYDYVFTIAQVLKNLSISNLGAISINPSLIHGATHKRPEILILTHSSYFFNVSRTNRIVRADASFALNKNGSTHQLSRLRNYVSPFEEQLEHVYKVANGAEHDHSTGNAIRSVLEAVGRFCRPDKANSVQEFISFLAGENNLVLQSVLIQSLSHGTYYDETPTPAGIKQACIETITVVNAYAEGQIAILTES